MVTTSKSKTNFKPNVLMTIFAGIFLILLYLFIFYWGLISVPLDIKNGIVNFLDKYADRINTYRISLSQINDKFIFHIIYSVITLLGILSFNWVLYVLFRKSENLEIPGCKFIPKIPNYFYCKEFIISRKKSKEYKERVRVIGKELTQCKIDLERIQQEKKEVEIVNRDLFDQMRGLIKTSKEINDKLYLQSSAIEELYNLMTHMLTLKAYEDSRQFFYKFYFLMHEFASAITRVAAPDIVDKHSSVMIISYTNDYLKIIGSCGLKSNSRHKTFKKGQGFAGLVWEKGQTTVWEVGSGSETINYGDSEPSFKSIIGVPINDHNNEFIGAFFIHSSRLKVFDKEKDEAILSYFSMLLAIIFNDYNRMVKRAIADGTINIDEYVV